MLLPEINDRKEKGIRKMGIDIIGNVPWGTHICQFYETKEDLIDILVPYFKAGLENNEFCMWVTSDPLNEEEAKNAMRKAVPNIDKYFKKGQIEILPHTEWYLKGGVFDFDMVLNGWINKLNRALAKGYDGMRVTGNIAWLEKKGWNEFADYEEKVNSEIGGYQIIAVCSYGLKKCDAFDLIDVVCNHRSALIARGGKWEIIESAERKKVEEELQERERKLRTIFDVLPVGISILDANRKIIYGNPALERILGISMEGLLRGDYKSRTYLRPDSTPMPAEEYASARVVKEQRAIYNVETGVLKEDGRIVWTDVSAVPVKFPDWKVVIVTSDITNRKRSEEELQKSERHRIIGTFISGIAHEIRNPLVSVKGFFQLLNDKEISEKDKQEIAGLAVNEIKRMEYLLDSLLSFARPSKGELIKSDIHKLIKDCFVFIKHGASKQGINMTAQLDADPSHSLVDPKQIQQVFLNFSMNALDAMKNGGTLRISTTYLKVQNMIHIMFRDTGHGIKKKNMPRLFEPFFTTKENGTGLGLSICQRIIENHKGKISVESEEGKGTTVHVSLPAL